jgi:hypothetical protein
MRELLARRYRLTTAVVALLVGGAVVGATGVWQEAVGPLLAVVLLAYFFRFARPGDVDEFTERSGLTTSADSRRFIASYLTTGRRLRVALVIVALVAPVPIAAALGHSAGDRFSTSWTVILWACLAGTVGAELAVTRPTGPEGVASLVPREPSGYLSRPLRWGPAAAGALAAIVWAGVPFLPGDHTSAGTASLRADGVSIAAGIVFAAIVPLVVVGAQRWILRRPQPLVAPELVAADDAVRAASVRNLAAVGSVMVLLNLAGGLFQYLKAVDIWALDWLFGAGVAVSLGLAAISWWSRTWWRPVRRQPFTLSGASA